MVLILCQLPLPVCKKTKKQNKKDRKGITKLKAVETSQKTVCFLEAMLLSYSEVELFHVLPFSGVNQVGRVASRSTVTRRPTENLGQHGDQHEHQILDWDALTVLYGT